MEKITKEKVKSFIPTRDKDSYKGTFGRVLYIGGNEQMGGAVILSASAGVYSGAGLVTVATHPSNRSALHARLPEAMCFSMYDNEQLVEKIKTMDGIVIGPGLGRDEEALGVLRTVYESLQAEQFVVIDGDAIYLHVNESLPAPKGSIIFTPHLGEWRTLTGLSPDDQNETDNLQFVKELNATVVLKKARTEVYINNEVWQNTAGNPSMATGGMGDTLAGMLGGFLAQFTEPKEAVLAAVFLHSYMADELSRTHYVTLPSLLIESIPKYMHEFSKDKPLKWI